MEHVAALLLIIGCSDDLAQCSELPAPVPHYASVEECEAELPATFSSFSGEYPQLLAQCIAFDADAAQMDAELVWEITGDGHLLASVEAEVGDSLSVASNESRDPEELFTR
jgi:hypothetical protein